MQTAVHGATNLTLKDRLSRLTHYRACALLGTDGSKLIQLGGQREVDLDQDVKLSDNAFTLTLPDAIVTLTVDPAVKDRLAWRCTACRDACEHVGAAFSLVLEEKMSLGLAAPPPERVPVEGLSEEQLVRQALAEREERARTEKMRVQSADPGRLWTDHTVTNAVSGKTYRVAMRGWQSGECYCTCPDFRTNTLGVCKHILHVQHKMTGKFLAAERKRPYVHRDHVVQDLSAQRSHGPLHERILPGTPVGSTHFLDAAGVEELPNATAIDPVVVEEQKSRLMAVRHGFSQLLNHPSHGWVGCDRKVKDLPAAVAQDQEYVQRREPNRGDGEEIDGPGDVQVIPQKRQPGGGLVPRVLGLDHVLSDRVFARRVVPQEQQRVPNSLGTPERILAAEPPDQLLHLLGRGRAPGFPSGLPPPVELEALSMPPDDGRRLNDE